MDGSGEGISAVSHETLNAARRSHLTGRKMDRVDGTGQRRGNQAAAKDVEAIGIRIEQAHVQPQFIFIGFKNAF
jgi:hypothetical protein